MKRTIVALIILVLTVSLFAQKKVGLVLSGGGAKGFAHIGMLKVLDELNIHVDYVVGTSMGAVIGSLYAAGYTGQQIEDMFTSLNWEQLQTLDVSREQLYISQKRWPPISSFYMQLDDKFRPHLPKSFTDGNMMSLQLFKYIYPVSYIDDFDKLPKKFCCVATNIQTGKMRVFHSGSVLEAIRASSAMPSFILPFTYDDSMYVDGGLSQNFPADIANEMGADIIIGLKANTALKPSKELYSAIDILSQSINISMLEKQNQALEFCDILLSPDLTQYSIMDFSRIKEIIEKGEIEARNHYPELINLANALAKQKTVISTFTPLPDTIQFESIHVEGNQYLSGAKVRDFTELNTGTPYTRDNIIAGFIKAYNSELFDAIYPRIQQTTTGYVLYIVCNERERKKLGFSFSYNDDQEFVASATADFNNYLQKNSKLLINLQAGGKHEANFDYVKNFGEHFGIYFRIFPYIRKYHLYLYNEQHDRTMSINALEQGANFGLGLFAQKAFIVEGYSYYYRMKIYQDVSAIDLVSDKHKAIGLGIKAYRETLDDYLFPMRGDQFLSKFTVTQKNHWTDEQYKRMYIKGQFLFPVAKNVSYRVGYEYGSFFKDKYNEVDPFFIGGMDSFMGLYANEKMEPFVKIATSSLRFRLKKDLFTDLQANFAKYGTVDNWNMLDDVDWGIGLKIGYRTVIAPFRYAISYNKEKHFQTYFSIGYDYDIFEFSRR